MIRRIISARLGGSASASAALSIAAVNWAGARKPIMGSFPVAGRPRLLGLSDIGITVKKDIPKKRAEQVTHHHLPGSNHNRLSWRPSWLLFLIAYLCLFDPPDDQGRDRMADRSSRCNGPRPGPEPCCEDEDAQCNDEGGRVQSCPSNYAGPCSPTLKRAGERITAPVPVSPLAVVGRTWPLSRASSWVRYLSSSVPSLR